MALLDIQHLSVVFVTREGTLTAVNDLSFTLEAGKVLGVVGESGSGKSVFCYSLLGLIPMPPGRIVAGRALFRGEDLLQMKQDQLRRLRGARIGMIFQDPMTSLNPNMSIGDQLMEPLVQHQRMSRKAAKARAVEALLEVGIRQAAQRIDSFPHEFSGGMRQRVMIAMALINEPDLLIADEPTTALDVTVQAQILALIRRIQQQRNLAVIFVSHDLTLVAKMADHLLVMKEGRVVERGEPQRVFSSPAHPYTQALLAAVPRGRKPVPKLYSADDKPVLEVQSLSKYFIRYKGFIRKQVASRTDAVSEVSFSITRGETLGLVGESGSGKSTLGRCIMRLLACDAGEVLLDGLPLTNMPSADLRRARQKFQMIFQDPYASLNPRMTVYDTLAEPLLTHSITDAAGLLQRVNQLLDEVGLSGNAIRRYPHEFSGGQRQRIAIARAIACQPQLIIADEPVSALDVTIQAQILNLLMDLTQKHHLTMLFISHDLGVIRTICDRVAVMQHGRIVEVGETETLFAQPKHPYTQALLAAIPANAMG